MRSRIPAPSGAVTEVAVGTGLISRGGREPVDPALDRLIDDPASVRCLFERIRPGGNLLFVTSRTTYVCRSRLGTSVKTAPSSARPPDEVIDKLPPAQHERDLDFTAKAHRTSQRTIRSALGDELVTRTSADEREPEVAVGIAGHLRYGVGSFEARA
jgi:hypothetical protein